MEMLEGTVRHHQAILMVKILLILRRAFECLLHERCVFRMHPLENKFYGRCCELPTALRGAHVLLSPCPPRSSVTNDDRKRLGSSSLRCESFLPEAFPIKRKPALIAVNGGTKTGGLRICWSSGEVMLAADQSVNHVFALTLTC